VLSCRAAGTRRLARWSLIKRSLRLPSGPWHYEPWASDESARILLEATLNVSLIRGKLFVEFVYEYVW
jgi:hypothetical protein